MRQTELNSIQELYDGSLTQSQLEDIKFAPWKYPPTYFLLLSPFKHLPYLASYILMISLTLIPFLIAVLLAAPDKASIFVALAYPGTLITAVFGQNGFLTAGLLGLGLTQLDKRPWLAGVFFGLLSFKPHFGVLLPIALIAGRYWKVFFSATLTFCIFILLSVMAYGLDPWIAFISSIQTSSEMQYVSLPNMTTIYAAVLSLIDSTELAHGMQALMAILVTAILIWVWIQPREVASTSLKAAVLCTTTLLATPFAFIYDMPILMLSLAWLVWDIYKNGWYQNKWQPWIILAITAAYLLTFISQLIYKLIPLQISPLVIGAILIIILHRILQVRVRNAETGII